MLSTTKECTKAKGIFGCLKKIESRSIFIAVTAGTDCMITISIIYHHISGLSYIARGVV